MNEQPSSKEHLNELADGLIMNAGVFRASKHEARARQLEQSAAALRAAAEEIERQADGPGEEDGPWAEGWRERTTGVESFGVGEVRRDWPHDTRLVLLSDYEALDTCLQEATETIRELRAAHEPPAIPDQDVEKLAWAQRAYEDGKKYLDDGGGQMIHVRQNRALGILFAEIQRLEKMVYMRPSEPPGEGYSQAYADQMRNALCKIVLRSNDPVARSIADEALLPVPGTSVTKSDEYAFAGPAVDAESVLAELSKTHPMPRPDEYVLRIDRTQIKHLLDAVDDDDTVMVLRYYGEDRMEPGKHGEIMPAGLYAWYEALPEEGQLLLRPYSPPSRSAYGLERLLEPESADPVEVLPDGSVRAAGETSNALKIGDRVLVTLGVHSSLPIDGWRVIGLPGQYRKTYHLEHDNGGSMTVDSEYVCRAENGGAAP